MDVFGALADPVRRSLLAELAAGPRRVADLAGARPISRPAVSKHLRLLLDAGVVSVAERGRERYYALDATGLAAVRDFVQGLTAAKPATRRAPLDDHALDALATEVRRTSRERRTRPAAPASTDRHDRHEETA